jgi:hypothetical protein
MLLVYFYLEISNKNTQSRAIRMSALRDTPAMRDGFGVYQWMTK